jgi:ArsR family transcriptional regulator
MASGTGSFLSADETMTILRVLADPRRYDVVRQLAAAPGPVACCDLAQANQVGASTMSHHLQQLEQAGLIDVSRNGKFLILSLARDRYEAFVRQLAADARAAPPETAVA